MSRPEAYELAELVDLHSAITDNLAVEKAFVASTEEPDFMTFPTSQDLQAAAHGFRVVVNLVGTLGSSYEQVRIDTIGSIQRALPEEPVLINTFSGGHWQRQNNITAAQFLGQFTLPPEREQGLHVPHSSPIRALAHTLISKLSPQATMDDLEMILADKQTPILSSDNANGRAIMVGGNIERQWNSLVPKERNEFKPDAPLTTGDYSLEHIAYLLSIVGSPMDRMLSMHLNPSI